MKLKLLTAVVATSALLVTGLFADSKKADEMKKVEMGMEKMAKMPFGNVIDIAYSQRLWDKLEATGLNSTPANLYIGGPPHGKVREVLEGMIDGRRVIVKRNYGGAYVSIENVSKDRAKYLKAVTVMMKMPKGYDPENNDWFWVKYKKDGTLHKNPAGVELAGKIAKGAPVGCIACHSSASGGDLVFKHNKEANAEVIYVK